VKELRRSFEVGEEKVGIAVVVVIDPGGSLAVFFAPLDTGLGRDILEGAVALVAVKAIGSLVATDKEVEVPVIVENRSRTRNES